MLITPTVDMTTIRPLLRSCAHRQQYTRSIFSAADLTVQKQTDAAAFDRRPAKRDLIFGKTFADHMFMIDYNTYKKWNNPRIIPFGDLHLGPAASCLHYGLQCFEGLKAYRSTSSTDSDDKIVRLFRPDKNMERLSNSMKRLHMPGHDYDRREFLQCVAQLVALDRKWIPTGLGYSLYLRPTVIAMTPYLGVAPPDSLLMYVITSPVGPYYKVKGGDNSSNGNNNDDVPLKPVSLTCDTPYIRAWPGGTGANKVGGNYGPTMPAQQQATQQGYAQNLWLLDDYVTEVGAMNVFFVVQAKDSGKPELLTPPLDRGDILPGVTRDSILYLARNIWQDDISVAERNFTMSEIKEAEQEGRLVEAFGAGTAAVVTPIDRILYKGNDVKLQNPIGDFTKKVWKELTGIQYGTIEAPPGWIVSVGENGEILEQ